MSKKGESVIKAIRYLDSFYEDLGLLFNNLENLLSEKGFSNLPKSGNYAAYFHNVSNNIHLSRKWTLKNIQRLYLEENLLETKEINSGLTCSASLYKTSQFNFPVLTCGVLTWNNKYTHEEIYDKWSCNEICDVVCDKSIWRFRDEYKKDGIIYHLYPEKELRNLKSFSFFFIDLTEIENSAVLEEIVNAMINLYHGNYDVSISNDLIIDKIPQKLIETWTQPVSV
jgi:hypothetical protein